MMMRGFNIFMDYQFAGRRQIGLQQKAIEQADAFGRLATDQLEHHPAGEPLWRFTGRMML